MAHNEVEVEVKVEEEEPVFTGEECVEEVKKIVADNNKSLACEIASRLKSDVEERLDITEEWVEQVTEMLDIDRSSAPKAVLPRVATALMNVNPVAYIPQFISLGPYHHWKLKKDVASSAGGTYQSRSLKISAAEEYKIMYAAKKLRKDRKSFNSIVEKIEGKRLEIERFYDWKIEEGQSYRNFAFMMAVDSSFLLCFLFGLLRDQSQSSHSRQLDQAQPVRAPSGRDQPAQPGTAPSGLDQPQPMTALSGHDQPQSKATRSGRDQPQPARAPSPGSVPSDDEMINLSALQACIKCDILKLENQIPLSVLRLVFDEEKDVLAEAHQQDFPYLLKKTYMVLSPFNTVEIEKLADTVATKPHLLDCMQTIVSPFLEMKARVDNPADQPLFQKAKHFLADIVPTVCGIFITHPSKRGHHDFLNAYNAGQLDKAGIKFQSFSNPAEEIRFDKYSHTLYLPQITVSSNYTEVFLRNMIALEFNDPERRNSVTRYVGLMDCLIDTPNDVRLLRDSDIIRRPSLMLTDEDVAKMWDGMCRPFFTGHLELPEELKLTLQEVLVQKYYTSRVKSWLRDFRGEYLSTPWKIIALLVGFCILAITVIQGYCSFVECTGKSEDHNSSTQAGGHGA